MKTVDYLNRVKNRLGISSDYALAKALGMGRSNASSLMNGKTTMGDETALKVAQILDVHPVIVLADVHAERERNPEIQAVWLGLSDKISLGFKSLIACATPRRIRLSA